MLYKHKKMRLLFFKTFLFSIAQSIQKRTDKYKNKRITDKSYIKKQMLDKQRSIIKHLF